MKMPKWFLGKRRWLAVILAFVVVIGILRNPLVRWTIISLAKPIANIDLSIEQVQISWTNIELVGIRVCEPGNKAEPQLDTKRVRIAFTLLDGICNGVWARRVVVNQPTLHLRFDAAGNLTSKFPEGNSNDNRSSMIPIREIIVRDASCVIHQTGREPFSISGMKLIGQFGETIRIRGDVPSLFDGSVILQTELNPSSLAGRSKLTITKVTIDSNQLSELPLIPASTRQLGLTSRLSASAMMEHPANQLDLRKHSANLNASLQQVQSEHFGSIADRFEITAVAKEGWVDLTAKGAPLSGTFAGNLQVDLRQQPVVAAAKLNVQGCNLRQFIEALMPELSLASGASVAVEAQMVCTDKIVEFRGRLDANAENVALEEIPVDDVIAEILINGSVPISDLSLLNGTIKGNVSSNGVSIADVATRFQLPSSTGRVHANAAFAIPLNQIAEPEYYSLRANVITNKVSIAGFELNDSTANLSLDNSIVSFGIDNVMVRDSFSNQVMNVHAGMEASLIPEGEFNAVVDIGFSPTRTLMNLLGFSEIDSSGGFQISAAARGRVNQVVMPEAWSATSTIKASEFVVGGESLGDFEIKCVLDNGDLTINPFQIPWRNNVCTIAATGKLDKDFSIEGTVNTNQIQIKDLAWVASQFSQQHLPATGYASIHGGVHASIPNWNLGLVNVEAGGDVKIWDANFGDTRIGELDLNWNADPNGMVLKSDSSDFLGGEYLVTASILDLDWTKTIVDAKFSNVQATRLVALSETRIPVSGVFDGGMQLTDLGSLQSAIGRAWITSRNLSAHQIPIEITSGVLSIESGSLAFTSEGKLSRGSFSATALSDLTDLIEFFNSEQIRLEKVPLIGKAELLDFPIDSLPHALHLPQELRTLRGNVSGTVVRESSMMDGHKVCDITGSLANLQLNRTRLSDRIVCDGSIGKDRVTLHRVDGRLADGRLSGRAEVRLSTNPTGTFEFAAQRVNLRRLAMAIDQKDVSGNGNILVRGKIGNGLSGSADLSVDHGNFAGVRVREAKFPVDWSYSQASRVARWQCRAGVIAMGGGKVHVASEGNYGTSLSMATTARIERVDSSKLLAGKSIGAGTIDGLVTINAKRARSPKQFNGRFNLDLANPKTLELPVLNQLPTIVSFSPPRPGAGKDGGHVEGRIAGGLVHIDELTIAQSNVQVLMTGNATQEGRLNFDVTVSTQADGPADQLLALADSPLMLAASAPVSMVAKANELMKDRVVNVHVGGTATRPTLRLQPGKQLSQNALRFFLKSTLGNEAAEIAERTQYMRR